MPWGTPPPDPRIVEHYPYLARTGGEGCRRLRHPPKTDPRLTGAVREAELIQSSSMVKSRHPYQGVSGRLVGPAAFKAVEASFARRLVGSIPIHSRALVCVAVRLVLPVFPAFSEIESPAVHARKRVRLCTSLHANEPRLVQGVVEFRSPRSALRCKSPSPERSPTVTRWDRLCAARRRPSFSGTAEALWSLRQLTSTYRWRDVPIPRNC